MLLVPVVMLIISKVGSRRAATPVQAYKKLSPAT